MGPRFIGLAMLALTATAAHPAEDKLSANALLPGCKVVAATASLWPNDPRFSKAHRCEATLLGLIYLAEPYGVCVPVGVTEGQAARVVVAYIEARPERMHEDFRLLALEAMQSAWPQSAWPCKRQ
jgi:hypothetical protein